MLSTASLYTQHINPTLNGVPGRPLMFVFPSKSGENAAIVRGCSLVFAPTAAKTVAIGTPSVDGKLLLCPIVIDPLYEASQESMDGTEQRHGVPTQFKHLAAEARKGVAEALRDIVIMVTGEAVRLSPGFDDAVSHGEGRECEAGQAWRGRTSGA